jgi:asparagine synthase (glutamine-hydrolysing)
VALMAKEGNSKVDTFSVVFEDPAFSEAKYAQEIANLYQTNHHEILLKAADFKDLIPEALAIMDHPSGDGLNTYVISKYTRNSGVKMAISGLGGDELFGGYSIFNQVPMVQAKKWLNSFPAYLRKPMAALYHKSKGTIESYKIKEVLKMQYFDMEFIYQFYRQVLMDDQVSKLIKSKELPLNRTFEITHDLVGYNKPGWAMPSLSRISVAEISTYMQNVLLRDTDQMSMANGLEVRVPFLDHELVAYTLGIRDEIKRPTSPKKLLVDSFADLIPESIYKREKMGFSIPFDQWMRTTLKSFCQDRLNQLKKIEYFKPEEIDRLWNQFLTNNKRVTWSRIWHLVVLGDWIERNEIKG